LTNYFTKRTKRRKLFISATKAKSECSTKSYCGREESISTSTSTWA